MASPNACRCDWLVVVALRHLLIDDVEAVQVVGNLALGVSEIARRALGAGDVLLAGDGLHLRSVQRDQASAYQTAFTADRNEGGARANDGLRVVVPKRGDSAIVRGELAQ
jgi:hypothetical protein